MDWSNWLEWDIPFDLNQLTNVLCMLMNSPIQISALRDKSSVNILRDKKSTMYFCPGEMAYSTAFHLGFHGFRKYPFTDFL